MGRHHVSFLRRYYLRTLTEYPVVRSLMGIVKKSEIDVSKLCDLTQFGL